MRVFQWPVNGMGRRGGKSCRHLPTWYAELNGQLRNNMSHLHSPPSNAMGSAIDSTRAPSNMMNPTSACFSEIFTMEAVKKTDMFGLGRTNSTHVKTCLMADGLHQQQVKFRPVLAFPQNRFGVVGSCMHSRERVYLCLLRSMHREVYPPRHRQLLLRPRPSLGHPVLAFTFVDAFWTLLLHTMPRIRHRMRSRRGSSQSHPSRIPSSSSSDSSPFGDGSSNYPRTRSG